MNRPTRSPVDQARLAVAAVQAASAHYARTGNTLQVRLCVGRLQRAQAALDALVPPPPPAPKPLMPWERDMDATLAFLAELDARAKTDHEAGEHSVMALDGCPLCEVH